MRERTARTVVNAVGTALLMVAAALGALACDGAPKVQCGDGDVKVVHKEGKSTHYTCHNGEWVKDNK